MTLWLAASGLLLAIIISIPLGVIAAVRRNRLPDHSASIFAVLGQAMPLFWLDIMLIIIFAVKLRLLPASGAGSYKHIILPAAGIAVSLLPILMRLTRSRMIEILSQDYIRTARAKGQGERAVVYKHALRNMMVPLLTIIGLFVAIALTGTVLTETVFTRPGLGKMLVDAIGARDYPLAQGAITVFTMIIIAVNLAVDMLYAAVDPRVTYR